MRYPWGDGTREDFEKRFYIKQGFGNPARNSAGQLFYYHEGADVNLKTGGDTDLGVSIHAISDWKIKYYHINTHRESGFGEHFVYETETPWGKRWFHHAHTQNSLDFSKITSGKAGDKLAEIDKTGRPRLLLPAHDHFTLFKVDPFTLPHSIDTIAKTKKQLNDWWEDPIVFLHKWNDYNDDEMEIREWIIGIREGLLGAKPSENELEYDLGHWSSPKEFVQRITGDGKFYTRYVAPEVLEAQDALKSAHKLEISDLEENWQSKLESANKDCRVEIEKLKLKKAEHLSGPTLLRLGLKKLLGRR